MQNKIKCDCCEDFIPKNPRLKGRQHYCGKKRCQNERKRLWYKQKLKSDPDYAARQKECKTQWRKKKPAHEYQKHYCEMHPAYVERNRKQQRHRNSKRSITAQENASEKIVKIDAFPKSGIFEAKILNNNFFSESQKIVKIDTLLLELTEYQGNFPTQNRVDCSNDCKD